MLLCYALCACIVGGQFCTITCRQIRLAHSSVCQGSHTLTHPSDLRLGKGCKIPSLEGLWMYGVTVYKIIYTPHAVTKSRLCGGRQLRQKKSDGRRKPRMHRCPCRESPQGSSLNFRTRNFGCKSVVPCWRVLPSHFPTLAAGEFAAKSYKAHPKTCLCFSGRLPAWLSCGVFC